MLRANRRNEVIELDELIDRFCICNELRKDNDDHVVNDDTQVGIEFAFEQISNSLHGKQIVREEAIKHLFDNYPEAYKAFYDKL